MQIYRGGYGMFIHKSMQLQLHTFVHFSITLPTLSKNMKKNICMLIILQVVSYSIPRAICTHTHVNVYLNILLFFFMEYL